MNNFDSMRITAVFMKVPQGYVALVEELPGAISQGATIDEARESLKEAETPAPREVEADRPSLPFRGNMP